MVTSTAAKRDVPQSLFDAFSVSRHARDAHADAVAELNRMPRHLLDEGNPNHPRYDNTLFGYNEAAFLRRQYHD